MVFYTNRRCGIVGLRSGVFDIARWRVEPVRAGLAPAHMLVEGVLAERVSAEAARMRTQVPAAVEGLLVVARGEA